MSERKKKKNKNNSKMILFFALLLCALLIFAAVLVFGRNGEDKKPDSSQLNTEEKQTEEEKTPENTEETFNKTEEETPENAENTEKPENTGEITSVSEAAAYLEELSPNTVKTEYMENEIYASYIEEIAKEERNITDKTSDWNMVLLNPTHSVPDGFIQDLPLKDVYNYRVDERIYYYVRAMFRAAEIDGIDLNIVSAFRNIETQTKNFNNMKNDYMSEGYSEKEAEEITATIIAVPGTSEHHSGLALDICSLSSSFENTEEFKWLIKHCTDYGFILRYPKEKQDVTKIVYEPWHYRFVGIKNAKKIEQSGLCYEEYLEKFYGIN